MRDRELEHSSFVIPIPSTRIVETRVGPFSTAYVCTGNRDHERAVTPSLSPRSFSSFSLILYWFYISMLLIVFMLLDVKK